MKGRRKEGKKVLATVQMSCKKKVIEATRTMDKQDFMHMGTWNSQIHNTSRMKITKSLVWVQWATIASGAEFVFEMMRTSRYGLYWLYNTVSPLNDTKLHTS